MRKRGPFRNEDFVQLAPSDAPFSALRSPNWMRTRGAKPDAARRQQRKRALRSFEWVSAWLSGIIPSGAPPPTPRRSPPRGSGERRALTPLLSPNHRLFALNHLVNLLSRHMLGLTACAIPQQLDDSIPRENYPHESAKGPFFFGVLSANHPIECFRFRHGKKKAALSDRLPEVSTL